MEPKKKHADHGGRSSGSTSSSKGSPAVTPAAAPSKGSKAPVSGSSSSKPSTTTDTAFMTSRGTSTGGTPPLAPAPYGEGDSGSESAAASKTREHAGSSKKPIHSLDAATAASAPALEKLSLSIPHAGRVVVAANWAEKMAEEIKDAREMVARAMEYEKWIQDWNKFRLMHSEQTHIPHPGDKRTRPQVDFDVVSQHVWDLYHWYASKDYVRAYDNYVSESMGRPELLQAPPPPGWPGQGPEQQGKPRKVLYHGSLTLWSLAEADAQNAYRPGHPRYENWKTLKEFTSYEADRRLKPHLVALRKHMMKPNKDRESGLEYVRQRLRAQGYIKPTCDLIIEQVKKMDWSTLPLAE